LHLGQQLSSSGASASAAVFAVQVVAMVGSFNNVPLPPQELATPMLLAIPTPSPDSVLSPHGCVALSSRTISTPRAAAWSESWSLGTQSPGIRGLSLDRIEHPTLAAIG